jgi:crossover junction endodeoxyribonuclease RuvC
VIGIDPGTATTGWACVETTAAAKPRLVACDAIRTAAHTPLADRLDQLQSLVRHLIRQYQPNSVAVEELFFAKNRKTAIAVSHARGAILAAVAAADLSVGEYTPGQVKQAIVGYGNADKRQIQAMLPAHVSADVYPTQDDTADAVAIALTHLTVVSRYA